MPRKSHIYEFSGRDLLALAALPLVPVALFSGMMHWGAAAGWLPNPCPALDTDRTILLHQADATRRQHPADLVLIGDSSCLMNVSAKQLSELWPGRSALNLGTLSYLDLHSFATLLRNFAAANPDQLRGVVLLMHPEALRRPSPAEYYEESLSHFYRGTDHCDASLPRPLCALGAQTFRGRILSRFVPQPLPGGFGREYGFTHDLWESLSQEHGSALDPGQFDAATAQGNPEYRLAPSLELASRTFRAAVPAPVRFAVGITPVPQGFAGKNHAQLHHRLLQTWAQWLGADITLDELPAVLPANLFASTTHLNAQGVRVYTEQLGQALSREFRKSESLP